MMRANNMINEEQEKRLGWLHAAKLVEDALEMRNRIYTPDGIRRMQSFVNDVRKHDGVGMDEVYSWGKIQQLLLVL